MKTILEREVKLPDYSVSYLINCDDSGLTSEDKKIIDDYMSRFYNESDMVNGSVIIDIGEDKPSFYWHPAFGLACNCYDATITILA